MGVQIAKCFGPRLIVVPLGFVQRVGFPVHNRFEVVPVTTSMRCRSALAAVVVLSAQLTGQAIPGM